MKVIILSALALSFPGTALAYFDAGTGSLIIQGLVGAITFITVFWGKVKTYLHALFSRNSGGSPSDESETSPENGKPAGATDSEKN